ncbi:SHOCT domain-containing protein [Streptomyces sp. NPDC050485]|uniref:SHOCT domain-containing protein n=1 Tax=Streptomyces sp. NPDC050485 TaxID=3365617 RepID=UPI003790A96F
MIWYGHGMSGWGWFAMSLSMPVFWALLVGAAVLLFRALSRGSDHPHKPGPSGGPPRLPAEQILAERYARGEIDEDEYHRRLNVLRTGDPPAKP